jgi:hypothetical protein
VPQASKQAERQKKSKEVEDQLAKANKHMEAPAKTATVPNKLSMEASNSQSNRDMTLKMSTDKKIVAPGTRDAPKFQSKRPQELRRFVRLMEDLWREAGVIDDEVKKSMIGKYADQESEEEWSAFETYEKGHSWEEFKDELIENYPEAAAAERGTPARIRQLCSETREVRLGDLAALYTFRRAFLAEAKKLAKPPAAMANRELVELFISCLSEPLASAVLQFLGNKLPSVKVQEKSTGAEISRRPEDKYDLEEVCKAAIQVSESSQGMFQLMKREPTANVEDRSVFLYNQPTSENKALTQKVEELEGVQALEKDRLVSMNNTLESKISGIEDLIKTLMAQSANKGDGKGSGCNKPHEASSSPAQKFGMKSMDNEKCFWCGILGHFQADCDDLKNQIRIGNVKVNPEGKLRLKDGSFIPNQPPGATLKERVDRHYSRRPSQFFHGEYEDNDPVSPAVPKYSTQYLSTSEDADRRFARLEAELEIRKREEALEQRKRKLEQEERKLEQSSGNSKVTNVVDVLGQLTDEEVAAVKAARAGFL